MSRILNSEKKKGMMLMILVIVSIIVGYTMINSKEETSFSWQQEGLHLIEEQMEVLFVPNLHMTKQGELSFNDRLVDAMFGLVPGLFVEVYSNEELNEFEDSATYEMILAAEANDENVIDENGNLIGEEIPVEKSSREVVQPTLDVEALRNVDHLISQYYIVDSTTSIDQAKFNIDTLLGTDMTLTKESKNPQVLIFHTHSQEAFLDSIPGDPNTSIVGMGAYLAQVLEEQYGIETIHHPGVYDLINGQLDRSSAYELAEVEVAQILQENPDIEIVIDLHRDGVNESTHLVTEVNGKQTAQVMFFNGVSRSVTTGDITYLPNPNLQANLAFSFQMQVMANEMYPGLTRKLYLKSYRYNLHLAPKSLLIEAGAQTNTVEEARNLMEVLGEILDQVIQK